MKKAKLVQERKEQARQEENEVNRRKAAELNLGYVAVEIPPEDVDIKDVKRTQLNAFLSMVPYTNAWYESQAALTEMDDLKRIRIERVKAEDLHLMTKVGKHDEASEKMMAETNYDLSISERISKLRQEQLSHSQMTILNRAVPVPVMDVYVSDRVAMLSEDPRALRQPSRMNKGLQGDPCW